MPRSKYVKGDAPPLESSEGSIYALLRRWADATADTPAILAPDREALNYAGLLDAIDEVRATLHACGIERGDRVVLALDNGPELAVALLGVASCATAAPLNPAYRRDEFAFYLSDLAPRAIVMTSNAADARAVVLADVADELAIPVLALETLPGEVAGRFRLQGTAYAPSGEARPLAADVALVLHTSGTTSRPKLVPLTHRNLVAAATSFAAWYALGPGDRCLGIMPLYHIQGIVGGLLAPLAAGGSVVSTPPFEADAFFAWLDRYLPTWYTAGPTFHRAILSRAEMHPEVVVRSGLRFIRSSSAPLAVSTLAQLETVFRAPVLEGYGMTETALHATSNPLPPEARRPGTVGRVAARGVEVAIVDGEGRRAAAGEPGEIVVRGPTVMSGYVGNPEANRQALFDGWLRTGDQGHLDTEGYLTITGRIKEIINRGGEKIAPAEIDAALLKHPGVADAASFPVEHPTLGEDVWAAVVLRSGVDVEPASLRAFVAEQLADFKVPRRIVVVEKIPKSHTGKLQRGALAARLGLIERSELEPRDAVEARIREIWRRVLERNDIWVRDGFFDVGGDSLKDVVMFAALEEEFGVEVESGWWWISEPTIEQLARQVRDLTVRDA